MSLANFNMDVIFLNIVDDYSSTSPMDVTLSFKEGFQSSADDWIGLFKVGWLTFEDAITSVSFSSDNKQMSRKEFTINGESSSCANKSLNPTDAFV